MKRRSNPHRVGSQSSEAWRDGYMAYQHNLSLDNKENPSEYEHPDCETCEHHRKQHYDLKVMFTIEDLAGTPSLDAKGLAEQLAEALPREWWQDSNMADWGTVAIYPLDDDDNLVAK
jgi:hypothetical protein